MNKLTKKYSLSAYVSITIYYKVYLFDIIYFVFEEKRFPGVERPAPEAADQGPVVGLQHQRDR